MAPRQIRWGTLGRVLAVVAAAVAGIVSLPALLGSDSPPPVPADVGLAPAPTTASQSPLIPQSPSMPPARPRRRLAHRSRVRERTHPPPKRSHPHRNQGRHDAQPPSGPASVPSYPAPVYSYVPPSRHEDFGFEP